ncbi:MAG: hypothetical protein JO270_00110 [Acidobacteriaceae bacterium]|nr:hypothetical protein [Acidobacteriaceae bacterium]
MAAIDFIKGPESRGIKKYKFHDATWDVSGSTLIMNGQPESGSIDWDKSRYLRVGREMEFFAFLSGSGVTPHYKVFLSEKKAGYVAPKDFKWQMPIPSDDGDDE